MPVFEVTDPDTGTTLELEGDSPPTEAELNEIFSSVAPTPIPEGRVSPQDTPVLSSQTGVSTPPLPETDLPIEELDGDGQIPVQPEPEVPGPDRTPTEIADRVLMGGLELAATLGSGLAGQVVSGVEGVGKVTKEAIFGDVEIFGKQTPESLAALEQIGREMDETQAALSFAPRTEPGKEAVQAVGEVLAPIGEFLETAGKPVGKAVFDATGSPALAAAAEAIPTLAADILSFGAGKAVKGARRTIKNRQERNLLTEAAPTKDQLKATSSAIFDEIDQAGITVKTQATQRLVDNLSQAAEKFGVDPVLHPDSNRFLKNFRKLANAGEPLSTTKLDTMRSQAQAAASALKPRDQALGKMLLDRMDDFLENAGDSALIGPQGAVKNLGKNYNLARELWGRQKKAETMEELFTRVNLVGETTSPDKAIRTEFKRILRSKKERKFFTVEERAQMLDVVEGSGTEGMIRQLAKLDPFTGGKLGIIAGGGGGFATGAATSAVGGALVPGIGFLSQKMAQAITVGKAQFADAVFRAGGNAKRVVAAYRKNTPKGERNPQDLNELLMQPHVNLSDVGTSDLAREAAVLARENRKLLFQSIAAVETVKGFPRQQEEEQ